MMAENNLPTPTSIKDLANPVYSGFISVTDIASSSTAWLLLQALVDNYGEDEATQILADIYKMPARTWKVPAPHRLRKSAPVKLPSDLVFVIRR